MAHIRISSESAGNFRKLPKLLRSFFVRGKFLTFEASIQHSSRNHQKYFSSRIQFDTISVERRICRMSNYQSLVPSRVSLLLRTSCQHKCNTKVANFSKQKQSCQDLMTRFKRKLHVKTNEPLVSGWYILK